MLTTKSRSPRSILMVMLVWALATLFCAASANVASASADVCGNASCLSVRGSGLHVDYVQPSVLVPPLVKYYGHSEVFGPGFHFNTPDRWFQNASATNWANQISWLRYDVNAYLPDGSKVCARFWRKNVPYNTYTGMGVACATIHR